MNDVAIIFCLSGPHVSHISPKSLNKFHLKSIDDMARLDISF